MRPADVLLIVLDTTRADHLSVYGYQARTTPNFDRLANEGERYESAYAQSSWTLPTIATILTGTPPHEHGAGRAGFDIFGIRDSVSTLAERLAGAGYRAGAVINVVWCNPRISSLNRGFEHYDIATSDPSNRGHRPAAETADAALDWLRSIGDDRAFLVVHFFDPHLTYDPPPPHDSLFAHAGPTPIAAGFGSADQVYQIRDGSLPLGPAQREALIARYDGELHYTDEQFGRLRAGMEALGRWESALVIVVGDHGEEFWDHGGFEHGHSHYRELLRVPLIVRRPGHRDARVVRDRVRQLDIAPTILEHVGLPSNDLAGQVLGSGSARYAVAEGSLFSGDLVSVRSDAGTLIRSRDTGEMVFFAPDDENEQNPLFSGAPANLISILDSLPPLNQPREDRRDLTPQQEEALRSLGYLR